MVSTFRPNAIRHERRALCVIAAVAFILGALLAHWLTGP